MEGVQGRDRQRRIRSTTPESQIVVSSRRRVLERLLTAMSQDVPRPVLLTGEPGAGKTWLTHRLAPALAPNWRVIHVELAGAIDAVEFLRLVGHSLGVTIPERLGAARLLLQSILHDEAADGRNWILVIDDAHRGSTEVWDEIQAVRNRLMQPGGFAAMIVVGQTELARAICARRFATFATSLYARLHLMPLDLDEARELLSIGQLGPGMDELVLEELHRDARGNPSILQRLADNRCRQSRADSHALLGRNRPAPPAASSSVLSPPVTAHSAAPVADRVPVTVPAFAPERGADAGFSPPSMIPAKPPIRVEEGLVEVGWEGDLDSELDRPAETIPEPSRTAADDLSFNEEMIEDRYAALQAWTEWTRNKGRTSVSTDGASAGAPGPDADEVGSDSEHEEAVESDQIAVSAAEPSLAGGATVATAPTNVRAELQHDHAPYSLLFTRLRQSR